MKGLWEDGAFGRFFSRMLLLFLITGCFPEHSGAVHSSAYGTKLSFGEKIPLISLLDTLTKEEHRYLGMEKGFFSFNKKKNFSLAEIQADYIILEFLNRYCVSCMIQAPVLDRLYHKILAEEHLRHRVKILAVGVGNNEREVHRFREEKKICFPMVPDPGFDAYEAIGDPGGTPYLLIVRKTPEGELLAAEYLGLVGGEEILLYKLRELLDLLDLDVDSFSKKVRERMSFETRRVELQISLSEKEIERKIGQSIFRGTKDQQKSIRKCTVPDYGQVYVIDSFASTTKRERWYAKVYSLSPVCDVCHPVYFLLIFSEQGIVTDFIPLHVTKYGNLPLTPEDELRLKKRIVGRNLKQFYEFQPEYDSITGATISVSLIFNSLNKAGELFQELEREDYIADNECEDCPLTLK